MTAEDVLRDLIRTVEATGGVFVTGSGPAPMADEDWLDLALVYENACAVLGHTPMLVPNPNVTHPYRDGADGLCDHPVDFPDENGDPTPQTSEICALPESAHPKEA